MEQMGTGAKPHGQAPPTAPPPLPGIPPTSGLAVWSLVLGILGVALCFGPLTGIPALILGIIALNRINSDPDKFGGKGLAIGGIVMGGVSFISIAFISMMAAIAIPSLLRARTAANEVNASAACKAMTAHEAVFRRTDADGNGVQDYWTADVAGFYAMKDIQGRQIKYIDVAMAKADAAPLPGGPYAPPSDMPVPKAGYLYMAMTTDQDGKPYRMDTSPADGADNPYNNLSRYGFCAYPAEHGKDGIRTFIVNEEGVVYSKDTGGEAVMSWPGRDPTMDGWVATFE
jgi:hypothetical protein